MIIPTLNEAANLEAAVDSAWNAGAAEVIVADGGSEDGTLVLGRKLRCTWLSAPRGRAAQQNAGAQAASGDVLLFLHADNRLGAENVARQIEVALADPCRIHGAMHQRIDAPGQTYRWLERGNAARVGWLGLPYGDQAIFVRRESFLAHRGFPDEPLMEDLILMQRLRRVAWPALIAGPVIVSPRRWQRHGVVSQTLRNWWLVTRYACGAKPVDLARQYGRHDGGP